MCVQSRLLLSSLHNAYTVWPKMLLVPSTYVNWGLWRRGWELGRKSVGSLLQKRDHMQHHFVTSTVLMWHLGYVIVYRRPTVHIWSQAFSRTSLPIPVSHMWQSVPDGYIVFTQDNNWCKNHSRKVCLVIWTYPDSHWQSMNWSDPRLNSQRISKTKTVSYQIVSWRNGESE